MDFSDLPLRNFLESIASETPTPGGGSVAAVALGMAAGLIAMAARFSREHWAEAKGAIAQAELLRARALPLAREDAAAYEDVLTAMRLPSDLEREVRDAAIGNALSRAADLPLLIVETAADVAALGALVAEQCNPNLRGDAVAGAVLAEGAARAAANLVAINLATTEADERVARARALVEDAVAAAQRALAAGS